MEASREHPEVGPEAEVLGAALVPLSRYKPEETTTAGAEMSEKARSYHEDMQQQFRLLVRVFKHLKIKH